MALPRQNISIPLTGGIDRETEDFLVVPPRLLDAHNVSYTRSGALKKRLGWDDLGFITKGESSWVAVPAHHDNASVAIFSENQAKRFFAGSSTNVQLPPIPHTVTTHPIAGFTGHVFMAQAAYAAGADEVGVVVSFVRDATEIGSQEAEAIEAWFYIFDSDWVLKTATSIGRDQAILPRIHVMKDGSGTEYWAIIGLRDDTGAAGVASGAYFLDAPQLDLNALIINITTGATSSQLLATDVYPFDVAGGQEHVMLDSHCVGGNGDELHIAYYRAGGALSVGRMNTSGTYNVRTVDAAATGGGSLCVWHESALLTTLVYTAETSKLYYANDTTGVFSSITHPSSPNGDFPILYKQQDGTLQLTDRVVTLTGSGPATPSLGGGGNYTPSYGHPLPRQNGGSFYWRPHVAESDFGADQQRYTGGKSFTIFESGPAGVREIALSNLAATRWDSWYTGTFFSGGAESLGVFQQLAYNSTTGAILVPLFYPNSGYLPPPVDYGVNWTAGTTSGIDREFANSFAPFDGAYQLVLTEIIFKDPAYTHVDHYGSRIVAMGQVAAFDGSYAINLSPQEPRGTLSVSATPDNSRYLVNTGDLVPGLSTTLANNEAITTRYLLSYVDKNGVRYRFPVYGGSREDPTAVELQNVSGSAQYVSTFVLTSMPPALIPAADHNGLSVEIYVTSVYTAGAASPDDEDFVGRVPITWDSANSQWIGDLKDIVANDGSITNPTPWPFYTEILPTSIPASNVVARAGNYMFLVPSEAPYELWVSKPLGSRLGPEFSPELLLDAPHDSGGIVALGAIGDHLFLLCRNGVWELFVGSGGPDADGNGGFPAFRRVSYDGCANPRGVVETPAGVFFMGLDGIMVASPSGVQNVGARITRAIEDYGLTESDIRCAYYDPVEREVWFYFMDDPAAAETSHTAYSWVYDLENDAWTSTQFRAYAVLRYKDKHCRYYADELVTQSTSDPTDGANYNSTSQYVNAFIQTPWLKLDSPVSYKRFRRMTTLWNWYAGAPRDGGGGYGSIQFKIAYNYNDTDVDTYTWVESAGLFPRTEISGLDSPEHLQSRFGRQKVDAIRITILDAPAAITSESSGNTLRWILAGLGLEVASKRGDMRLQQEAKK